MTSSSPMLETLKSVLNKIAPKRFGTLMQQVKRLNIERLNGAADLIPEQAMSDPGFCATYANMCKDLVEGSSSHASWMRSQHLPNANISPLFNRGAEGRAPLHAVLEVEGRGLYNPGLDLMCKHVFPCSSYEQGPRKWQHIAEFLKSAASLLPAGVAERQK